VPGLLREEAAVELRRQLVVEVFPKYLVRSGDAHNEYADCDPHVAAERIKDLPTDELVTPPDKPDRKLSWDYGHASRLGTSGSDGARVRQLAQAYDLTCTARDKGAQVYSEEERTRIEREVLLESCYLAVFQQEIHNKSVWNRGGAAAVGAVVGHPGLVRFGLEGLKKTVDGWFLPDGGTAESAAYAQMTFGGISTIPLVLRDYSDPPGYTSPEGDRIDHLVLVDGKDQTTEARGGSFHLFAVTPRVKVMEASSRAYDEARLYRRTCVQIDHGAAGSYLVDLFRVEGGKGRQYVFHGPGKDCQVEGLDLAAGTSPLPLTNARSAPGGAPWSITWQLGKDYTFSAFSPGGDRESVALGDGWAQREYDNSDRGATLPYVVRTAEGPGLDQFVSVFVGGPTDKRLVKGVRRLPLPADSPADAVALEVQTDAGQDVILSALTPRPLRVATSLGEMAVGARVAVVLGAGDQPQAACLVGGTQLSLGRAVLSCPAGAYGGKVVGVGSVPGESYFVLDGNLPEGRSLVGQTLLIADDDLRRACPVRAVKAVDDQTRVYTKASGVGFEARSGGTWEFLPVRTWQALAASTMAPASAPEPWSRPLWVVHGGGDGDAPENTLAALKKSVALGAKYAEVDLRVTKDGQIVLIHDETLDRTTNGEGRVSDLTYAQIKQHDAGSWLRPEFREQRVPLLTEVLEFARANDLRLLLHVKEPQVCPLLYDLLEKHGMVDKARVYMKAADAPVRKALDPKVGRYEGSLIQPWGKKGVEIVREALKDETKGGALVRSYTAVLEAFPQLQRGSEAPPPKPVSKQ
jgi:hypothetical protein